MYCIYYLSIYLIWLLLSRCCLVAVFKRHWSVRVFFFCHVYPCRFHNCPDCVSCQQVIPSVGVVHYLSVYFSWSYVLIPSCCSCHCLPLCILFCYCIFLASYTEAPRFLSRPTCPNQKLDWNNTWTKKCSSL